MADGVFQNPDGTWSATVGGKVVATTPDNQSAQNAFIENQPGGSATATPFPDPGFTSNTPTPNSLSAESFYNADAEKLKEQALEFASTDVYRRAVLAGQSDQRALDAAIAAAHQTDQLIQTYGDQAIQALSEAGRLGVSIADILSRLGGPANAFAYDRAISGVNASGLSNAIGALTGIPAPSYQAMGPTTPKTLGTLAQTGNPGAGNVGGSIIDQLLGIASSAETGYENANRGIVASPIPKLPFSTGGLAAVPGSYTTVNGPKTLAQMHAELQGANYPGPWDDASVIAAYARTTNGAVTPASSAPAVAPAVTPAVAPAAAPAAPAAPAANVPAHVQTLNDLIAARPAGSFTSPALSTPAAV
jgi:hypothetical protein